jgi:hypothetical protein
VASSPKGFLESRLLVERINFEFFTPQAICGVFV